MAADLEELESACADLDHAATVDVMRSFWRECMALRRNQHRDGREGVELAAAITADADTIVRFNYRRASRPTARHALVALGGYGRGEMGPHSDIDLLFLFAKESDKDAPFISGVLNPLWDLAFTVGHSSRTTAESVKMLRDDLESCTAMMDGRLLEGDVALFEDFRQRLYKKLPKNTALKIHRLRQDRSRNSGSVQLLEPSVKESPGGLREIHILEWALKAAGRTPDLEESWKKYCDASDLEALTAGRSFLWRVRHELHFSQGRCHDVLGHELKPAIAAALGFKAERPDLAAEDFMQEYYRHAGALYHLADMVFKQLMRRPNFGDRRLLLEEGVVVSNEEIYLPEWERYFQADSLRFIRIFHLAYTKRLEFSEQAQRAIRASLHLIDDGLRRSPAARDLFMGMLRRKFRRVQILRSMHDLGVLGAYLPEFGSLTGLVQYDIYHLYTVDEHTLVALENLEALGKGERRGTLRRVYDRLERHDLLWLATMLHDVGKSKRDDHIVRGIEMGDELLRRLGLPEEDRRFVLFLIERHQDMVIMSQRRDLDDYTMIAEFAGSFANVDWLRALYLLSYADLSAVATDAWSDWHGALLWELYYKTEQQLESGLNTLEQRQRAQALLADHLIHITGRWPAQKVIDFQHHTEQLPPRYLVSYDRLQIESHLELVKSLGEGIVVADFVEGESYTELAVCTQDRSQLLAKVCGVLAVNDIDILRADVHTREDEVVLDLFQVRDVGGAPILPPHKKSRLLEQLDAVVSGQQKARELFDSYSAHWGRRRAQTIVRPPVIKIENQVSDRFTVIDVEVQDSAGLLYTLTYALAEMDLDIHMAIVHTVAERAVDAFYVVNGQGEKILNHDTLDRIHQHLLDKLAVAKE
jgi:[protein-PII] uridylyltransferase